MNWYYANNGQQAGPIPESELDSLAQRGVIAPSTLVWREGMAQWQPYSSVRQPAPPESPAPAIALPPIITQAQCVECQRFFAKDDLLRYENAFVCATCKPAFFQKIREGVAVGFTGGLWRSGKLLVMRKETALPDRCVKCNAPASGLKLKRKLFWHSPFIYLLIPVGLLVYAIVATIIGKRAKIEIGLCDDHRGKRKRDLLIAWGIFVAGFCSFIISIVAANGWYALTGLSLVLVAGVYGLARCPMVTPGRIDDHFVWLKGVSKDYMADLPEFTGRR